MKGNRAPKGSYTIETLFVHQPGTEDVETSVWRDRKERMTIAKQVRWTKHWKPSSDA